MQTTTLNRKMWQVAAIHFCLTLLVLCAVFYHREGSGNFSGQAYETYNIHRALKIDALYLLQPQLLLEPVVGRHLSSSFPVWLFTLVYFGSTPIWSLCFGWLYAQFIGRLNRRFPKSSIVIRKS